MRKFKREKGFTTQHTVKQLPAKNRTSPKKRITTNKKHAQHNTTHTPSQREHRDTKYIQKSGEELPAVLAGEI